MATILIAGMATVDIVFDVDEMPRRAEKYRARDARLIGGGGAANAAVAAVRLGATALLAARLGDDAFGDIVLGDLAREGVDCRLVRRFPGGRTSFSSVFADPGGERQIVNFRDNSMPADAGWLNASGFDAALSDTRWPDGALAAMQAARRAGRPGVIDAEAPVGIAAAALGAASHIAFSAQGLRDFAGADDYVSGLERAAAATGAFVCVTDGESGVTFVGRGQIGHVPAFRVEAAETLGAGDVWHGAFALALGEGQVETDAIRFANAVAALKCMRTGGRQSYPTRDETESFMRERT